jgi:hypothetical protein
MHNQKMKFLFFLLCSLLLFSGCHVSQKALNSGNYDEAIDIAVKKLRRNKQNYEQITILQNAFTKAVTRDKNDVLALKGSGQPDCWDDVFNVYRRLKYRQDLISPLLPLIYKNAVVAQFPFEDYNSEITSSRDKAAEYYYQHGQQLLQSNNKYNARKAYDEFGQVLGFFTDYKDVRALRDKAHAQGITYILMGVKNNTNQLMPQQLERDLLLLPLGDLNNLWTQYHSTSQQGLTYDYTIVINMKNLLITPDEVQSNNYSETKEIEEGWQYVLDGKGNTVKDSLGKPVKAPKFIRVSAQIKEVHQLKKAGIQGTLDMYDNSTNTLSRSEPIMAENIFENHTATAFGDLRALTPESKAKLGAPPKPFPPTADMIYNAGLNLKNICKDIVWNNYRGQIR